MAIQAMEVFPICDDLTDAEDNDDVFATSTPICSMQSNTTWLAANPQWRCPRWADTYQQRRHHDNDKPATTTPIQHLTQTADSRQHREGSP